MVMGKFVKKSDLTDTWNDSRLVANREQTITFYLFIVHVVGGRDVCDLLLLKRFNNG